MLGGVRLPSARLPTGPRVKVSLSQSARLFVTTFMMEITMVDSPVSFQLGSLRGRKFWPLPSEVLWPVGTTPSKCSALRCKHKATRLRKRRYSVTESQGMGATARYIYQERGIPGFFRGVFPRVLLGIWQTFFMVTIARVIKERGLL